MAQEIYFSILKKKCPFKKNILMTISFDFRTFFFPLTFFFLSFFLLSLPISSSLFPSWLLPSLFFSFFNKHFQHIIFIDRYHSILTFVISLMVNFIITGFQRFYALTLSTTMLLCNFSMCMPTDL